MDEIKSIFDEQYYTAAGWYWGVYRFFKYKIIGGVRDLKFRCQRFIRGWSDADAWDIDLWMIRVLEPMLRYFESNTCSHPNKYTYAEWKKRLTDMADALHLMSEDNVVDMFGGYENYDYDKVGQTMDENKKRFFKLFEEDFWSLWD